MASPASENDIMTVPKVELHIHLNGAITPATATAFGRRHGADAAPLRLVDGRYPGRYADFEDFLRVYVAANDVIRTPEDLEELAATFARGQAAQFIVYSEVILTAMMFVRNGMEPSAMWAAIRRGFAAGGPDTRIALVVDASRDFDRADTTATIRLVEAADAPIVGLCLTGVSSPEPISTFVGLGAAAKRLQLGFEVHAGERAPASSVVEAIDVLGADRIGHGVTAIEDPALMDRLVREQVPLDVCPSSNVGLGVFPSLATHAFAAFWRAGINMTISSDDPPFFNTTLTDELRHVVRIAGLSRDDLAELQRRAARNSFAAPDVKAELLARIDAWVAGG